MTEVSCLARNWLTQMVDLAILVSYELSMVVDRHDASMFLLVSVRSGFMIYGVFEINDHITRSPEYCVNSFARPH